MKLCKLYLATSVALIIVLFLCVCRLYFDNVRRSLVAASSRPFALQLDVRRFGSLPSSSRIRRTQSTWKLLLWTGFFQWETWGLDFAQHSTEMELAFCPTRCVVSYNRSVPSHHDALLFHGRNSRVPPPATSRRPRQVYVFFLMETPFNKHRAFVQDVHFFNWTATYSRRSDIFVPYFGFLPGPETDLAVYDRFRRQPWTNGRTPALVAWIVSACHTSSKRERYVKQLQQHLRVDIYGRCGPLSCPKNRNCYEAIAPFYRFYLALENAFCEDYITEKVMLAYRHGMVPVVLGGADYKHLLPPNSYIDMRHFESPASLATHLQRVANNIEDYAEYFSWRQDFHVRERDFLPESLCDICITLERSDLSVQRNVNVNQFWNTSHCYSPS